MRFFTDTQGRTYPVDRIRKMYPASKRDGEAIETCMVDLDEDQQVRLYASVARSIEEAPIQMIPAEVGTAFLYAGDSPDEPVYRSTIIGWALCADGNIRAVTPAGIDDGGVSNADTILLHDGRVHTYDSGYESVDAWVKNRFKQTDG